MLSDWMGGCVGKQVISRRIRLFQKKVLKYIVHCFKNLVFKNLAFKFLVFGVGLQVCEVLRLKSSSIVIRLTGTFPSVAAWLYITSSCTMT